MAVPEEGVPEFIHLLPAGTVTTQDGRGPYTVPSLSALAEQLNAGRKLALDECHATDLAAPAGRPAPARGWMTDFEARDDGLWARVKWTAQGRALMEDQAYNGISPVIQHTRDGTVVGLLRASLTNAPNLKGLTALHQSNGPAASLHEGRQTEITNGETSMDWKAKLIELLGLGADATDEQVTSALESKCAAPATHSQQVDIATHPVVVGLQSEIANLTTQLNSQSETTARDKATAFVDGAIADGRIGVKPARDVYIQMHMEDPERARTLIEAQPILKGGTALQSEIAPAGGDDGGLDDGDRRIMALMGLDEDSYKASRDGAAKKKEAL